MIAFELSIEGKQTIIAGVEDWWSLGTHVHAIRNIRGNPPDQVEYYFAISGAIRENEQGAGYHVTWKTPALELGDKITLRIVETNNVDTPNHRYRSDSEVQESSLSNEEIRALRYQDYLELKAEFEGQS